MSGQGALHQLVRRVDALALEEAWSPVLAVGAAHARNLEWLAGLPIPRAPVAWVESRFLSDVDCWSRLCLCCLPALCVRRRRSAPQGGEGGGVARARFRIRSLLRIR